MKFLFLLYSSFQLAVHGIKASFSTRQIFLSNSASCILTVCSAPQLAVATTSYPQEKQDKENIAKGYKRLSYLLDNWEKETTVCGRSDNPYIGK